MKYDYVIVGAWLFGDRLWTYKYYDMDKTIEKALELVKGELWC